MTLASVHFQRGHFTEVLSIFSEEQESFPVLYYVYALCYYEMSSYDDASASLRLFQ